MADFKALSPSSFLGFLSGLQFFPLHWVVRYPQGVPSPLSPEKIFSGKDSGSQLEPHAYSLTNLHDQRDEVLLLVYVAHMTTLETKETESAPSVP